MKSTRNRLLRLAGVVVLMSLLFAACGGDDDDEAAESSVTTAAGSEEAPGGQGIPPDGVLEFGTEYTVRIDPNAAPSSLSIPPGSVTTMEVKAPATNTSIATISSSDFSLSATVEPGATAGDDIEIITAREAGIEMTVSISGLEGDEVTFTIDNELQPDDPDGGDAPEIITDAIPVDGAQKGLLGGLDTVDYYTFDANAGDVLSLALVNTADGSGGLNASLEFNGEERRRVSAQPGGEESISLVTTGEEAGTWYVQVWGGGTYEITVSAEGQTDGGSDGDAGDDPTGAVAVESGTFSGLLGDNDVSDYYEFDLPTGAAVEMTLRTDATAERAMNARVFVNGTEEGRINAAPGGTDSLTLALSNDAEGTANIEVWSGIGSYEIDLSVGQQEDGGTEGDAGNEAASAKALDGPGEYSGLLSNDDSNDFYSIPIATAGPLPVTLTVDPDAERAMNLRLFVNGTEVKRTNAGAGGSGQLEDVVLEAPGDVVIEVWAGIGGYTFTVGDVPEDGGDTDDGGATEDTGG